MQDRSREFQATVQALRASVGGRQEERPKTQLFITANNINKGITECHNKLHQLQLLSQNKGMFGDRPVEIQELTSIIKEELGQLNLAVKKLQEHVKKENNRWSEHKKVHHNTIVTSLNKRLKSATEKFKKTLEQRTANLKAARQRRSEFSGKGFDGMGAGGMSDMPTLMSTQQAMQQHGDSAAGGPGNGNGDVAIDLGQTQEMLMYEEQDTYVSQRAAAMQNIEQTIADLGQIFTQLAETIQQQGEKIERIDTNMENVSMNVEAAHTELVTYYNSLTSNRMLMFKIFGVLLVFFILFVVVLA